MPQHRTLFEHLNFQKGSKPEVFVILTAKCASLHTFWTSPLPKGLRTRCVSTILTSKYASRHNGMHVLKISSSKSLPNMVCLRVLASKCASRHNGAYFFDISTPKGVFDILTSTCASRRNGVSFLIVQLTR